MSRRSRGVQGLGDSRGHDRGITEVTQNAGQDPGRGPGFGFVKSGQDI